MKRCRLHHDMAKVERAIHQSFGINIYLFIDCGKSVVILTFIIISPGFEAASSMRSVLCFTCISYSAHAWGPCSLHYLGVLHLVAAPQCLEPER